MTDQIKDIVIPILKQVQSDNARIKTDIIGIVEHVESIDGRLGKVENRLERMEAKLDNVERRVGVVECHMTGFMSTARYLELEMNATRGRLESLEDEKRP